MLCFRIVLVGLVLHPSPDQLVEWVGWCSLLATGKALVYQGLEMPELSRTRPLALRLRHLCFVSCILALLSLWAFQRLNETPSAVPLFRLFDISTIGLELAHSVAAHFILRYCTEPAEINLVLDYIFQIVHLVSTLFHYLHVCLVNGLSLSLVDILLSVNISRTCSTLLHKCWRLIKYVHAKTSLEEAFPTVIDAEMLCSICLTELHSAKRLSCGHCLHLTCLRRLIEHESSRKSPIKCPLCRHHILIGKNDAFLTGQDIVDSRMTVLREMFPSLPSVFIAEALRSSVSLEIAVEALLNRRGDAPRM